MSAVLYQLDSIRMDDAAETFDVVFEGMTVTVMTSRQLRRELALLSTALRPAIGAGASRVRFPQPAAAISDAAAALRGVLPPVPPATGAELAHVQCLLPGRPTSLLRSLAIYAWRTLRAHPAQRAWLVPAVYALRMPMLLEQQLWTVSLRQALVPPWIYRG